MVEQPAYITGVFGTNVNVGAGEAFGVASGVARAQDASRKKNKRVKRNIKTFFVCINSPFSAGH
jgi:phage tail tape-measure protein